MRNVIVTFVPAYMIADAVSGGAMLALWLSIAITATAAFFWEIVKK